MTHFGTFTSACGFGPEPHPTSRKRAPPCRPLRLADQAVFPNAALSSILEYGLCVPNLMDVSSVCRRWMKATQEPLSWAGKTVIIQGARGITREQLSAWLRHWRLAHRLHLHLTYSQMDLLAAPLMASHAIVFLCQNEGHHVWSALWRERVVGADGTRVDNSFVPLGLCASDSS